MKSRKFKLAAARALAGCALLWLGLQPGNLAALSVEANPIRLMVDPANPIAMLTVTNHDTTASQFQIMLMDWSQVDGADRLAATRDVLANPPIFALQGGAQQVIRLALRSFKPSENERSFRVIVQELPRAPGLQGSGAGTLLRISIPLFVSPAQRQVGLEWHLRPAPGGAALVLRNTGNVHIQVLSLKLMAMGRVVFDHSVNTYALPGATRDLSLDLGSTLPAGTPIDIVADTDQGRLTTTATMQSPDRAGGSG